MKRAVLFLMLILLTGCAPEREPDQLSLVRVLGVDGGREMALTAVCEDERPAEVREADFEAARRALPWSGEKKLSLTGVSHLVIGPEVELAEVLRMVLEDVELGASAGVWFAPTGAGPLLTGCEDPVPRLELLVRQGIPTPTAAEALAALLDEGGVTLPVLVLTGEELTVGGEYHWKN